MEQHLHKVHPFSDNHDCGCGKPHENHLLYGLQTRIAVSITNRQTGRSLESERFEPTVKSKICHEKCGKNKQERSKTVS